MTDQRDTAKVKGFGVEAEFKSTKLNTFLTALTCMVAGAILYSQVAHANDQRDMVNLLRELVQGQREGNCLMSHPMDDRPTLVEFCKRITQR